MTRRFLSQLPYGDVRRLSRTLSSPTASTNWEALIAAMPESFYSLNDVQHFSLDYMKMDTGPSMSLLKDLCHRNVEVDELRIWLKEINNEEALQVLKPRPSAPPQEEDAESEPIVHLAEVSYSKRIKYEPRCPCSVRLDDGYSSGEAERVHQRPKCQRPTRKRRKIPPKRK
eukprot:m.64263 g.64263  ORF g.64263 m.64263 type:complete len:171 (+) comp35238_c0_seq4:127-639(+)